MTKSLTHRATYRRQWHLSGSKILLFQGKEDFQVAVRLRYQVIPTQNPSDAYPPDRLGPSRFGMVIVWAPGFAHRIDVVSRAGMREYLE
jgi:hypothetical protein